MGAEATVTKYQKRISGPLLDHIDIHVEVPRVHYVKLSTDWVGESSDSIRKLVQVARDIQNKRFSGNGSSDIVCNADMSVGQISKPDAVSNEPDISIPVCLPPHAKRETGSNDCRLGWK